MAVTEGAARRRYGAPAPRQGELRWVPWLIVGCFLAIAAANGALVYFALSSSTGLAVDEAYEEGLAYNRIIAESEKQARLGWQIEIAFVPEGQGTRRGELVIEARAPDGKPLDGLAIEAELVRPVEPIPPLRVAPRADGNGRYAALVAAPRSGQWVVRLSAMRGDAHYQTGRRIMIP